VVFLGEHAEPLICTDTAESAGFPLSLEVIEAAVPRSRALQGIAANYLILIEGGHEGESGAFGVVPRVGVTSILKIASACYFGNCCLLRQAMRCLDEVRKNCPKSTNTQIATRGI